MNANRKGYTPMNEQEKIEYIVRDQYGIERPMPHFQPQTDDQIRYIVRARNVTIIRKTATEKKEFTPQSQINLQAVILNTFEILHATNDWITIEMIQQHLATLQIHRNDDELLDALRSIYKAARNKANKIVCSYRTNMDGENEFQIKQLNPA